MNVFIALKGSHFWFLFEKTIDDDELHLKMFAGYNFDFSTSGFYLVE